MTRTAARKLRASAHRVRSVFVCRDEFVGIRRDTDASYHQQQGGSGEETAKHDTPCFVDAQAYKQRDCVDEDDDCKIICDLHMVCLYLHAQGKCKQRCPQNGLRQPS